VKLLCRLSVFSSFTYFSLFHSFFLRSHLNSEKKVEDFRRISAEHKCHFGHTARAQSIFACIRVTKKKILNHKKLTIFCSLQRKVSVKLQLICL
jgi:hypothetical protein